MQKNNDEEKKDLGTLQKEMTFSFRSCKTVNTNILILDKALNGLDLSGEVVQIIGESGIGKSTLILQMIKELCNQEYKILFVDAEGSVTKEQLESVGVYEQINKKLFYVRASTFKDVEKVLDQFIDTDEIQFIFIDSIACLVHNGLVGIDKKKSISITTNNSNYSSKQLTLFMQKYNALAKSKGIVFVLVNQLRSKFDNKMNSTLKEAGGKNVKYNSDVILKLKKATPSSEFTKLVTPFEQGIPLIIEVVKSNKCSPKSFPGYLIYGRGLSDVLNSIYALIHLNVIKKVNGHYSCKYFKANGIKRVYSLYCEEMGHDDKLNQQISEFYDNL